MFAPLHVYRITRVLFNKLIYQIMVITIKREGIVNKNSFF